MKYGNDALLYAIHISHQKDNNGFSKYFIGILVFRYTNTHNNGKFTYI